MSLYFDISWHKCPSCKETIKVEKFQDFSTRFGKRISFDCPHCGIKVNWSKKPHFVANVALWLAFLTFPLPYLGVYSFTTGMVIFGSLLLLGGFAMLLKKLVIEE